MNMETKIPPNSSIGSTEQQPMKFHCENIGGVSGEIETTPILMIHVWNVIYVHIRRSNTQEGWHFRMNRHVCKHHLSIYELLQLMID
ncbi:hypothetical protein T03_15263 [Trichinella britovi]|uniref:Uncharacterized protein n=1 Tax=Trichinella britovi TaxID=45882 RepID=A0A0V1CER1_TRIBR|nr:hypothetical protein T03_15263 [Trichinella britovi]